MFEMHSTEKPKRQYPIVVPIPAYLYQLMQMLADKQGITLSDLARQIVEHGRNNLPWKDGDDENAPHNLTFHVSSEYYDELRLYAGEQDCFFKSLMLYWFVSCVKDAERESREIPQRQRRVP